MTSRGTLHRIQGPPQTVRYGTPDDLADDPIHFHDWQIERRMIEAVLVSSPLLDKIPDFSGDDMDSDRHRILFKAMREEYREAGDVDAVKLRRRLAASGNLKRAGGDEYLTELCDSQATSKDDVAWMADQLRTLALKRQTQDGLKKAHDVLQSTNGDLTKVHAHVKDLIELTEGVTGRTETPAKHIDFSNVLVTPLEPIPWIVPGHLCQGDRRIVAADGGVGKSLIETELAINLARSDDRRWMSTIPILGPALRVLVVDNENPKRLVMRRIQQLCMPLGISQEELASLPIRYVYGSHINLDDDAGMSRMRAEIEDHRPDIVFCDSLIRFHRRNENENVAMAQFLDDKVGALVEEYGTAFSFTHHTCKPNQDNPGHGFRGAGEIKNNVEQMSNIVRRGTDRTMTTEKTRWEEMEMKAIGIEFRDTEDGGLVIIASPSAKATGNRILELLEGAQKDGMPRKEIGEENGCRARLKRRAGHEPSPPGPSRRYADQEAHRGKIRALLGDRLGTLGGRINGPTEDRPRTGPRTRKSVSNFMRH